ncbi:hypothetical protein [Allonocardiopsis opalescens]|uniref:Uncharacterized protein n=1 Tax=Allonocardiopsis opalescens TaxID=1144618 RepID=A0A2T0PP68_9ACTN|nr:hypothetical protein [Allonocardiopsis opalescens]PRX90693.1 hypothetical protein CLV72_11831 [Allonocardiopsis opalescens]
MAATQRDIRALAKAIIDIVDVPRAPYGDPDAREAELDLRRTRTSVILGALGVLAEDPTRIKTVPETLREMRTRYPVAYRTAGGESR